MISNLKIVLKCYNFINLFFTLREEYVKNVGTSDTGRVFIIFNKKNHKDDFLNLRLLVKKYSCFFKAKTEHCSLQVLFLAEILSSSGIGSSEKQNQETCCSRHLEKSKISLTNMCLYVYSS